MHRSNNSNIGEHQNPFINVASQPHHLGRAARGVIFARRGMKFMRVLVIIARRRREMAWRRKIVVHRSLDMCACASRHPGGP